jgi:hypothetical protein
MSERSNTDRSSCSRQFTEYSPTKGCASARKSGRRVLDHSRRPRTGPSIKGAILRRFELAAVERCTWNLPSLPRCDSSSRLDAPSVRTTVGVRSTYSPSEHRGLVAVARRVATTLVWSSRSAAAVESKSGERLATAPGRSRELSRVVGGAAGILNQNMHRPTAGWQSPSPPYLLVVLVPLHASLELLLYRGRIVRRFLRQDQCVCQSAVCQRDPCAR